MSARLRGSDKKQPLKSKVNGLTVTCSVGLTVAHTQGESSTTASTFSVLLMKGENNMAVAHLFMEFLRVYLSQGYKVETRFNHCTSQ